MVSRFTHSISLPLSPSRSRKNGSVASYHVRSVSLPCRSHPTVSHLDEQIQAVRSWSAKPEASSVWIEAGLAQIESLLIALEEFLNLCQTQQILRCTTLTDSLLDNFLLLADIYGSFVSTIVSLKQNQSEVQSAIRRADKNCLVSALKSQRHLEKELAQLASCLKNASKCRPLGLTSDVTEAEITGILVEAIGATAVASVAIFSVVTAMSASASSTEPTNTNRLFKKLALNSFSNRKFSDEEFNIADKLEELEMCIGIAESYTERVFRRLISLRVSLLNISTASV